MTDADQITATADTLIGASRVLRAVPTEHFDTKPFFDMSERHAQALKVLAEAMEYYADHNQWGGHFFRPEPIAKFMSGEATLADVFEGYAKAREALAKAVAILEDRT